jgi:leucyl-tRNA synthetase
MREYDPGTCEPKWQQRWREAGVSLADGAGPGAPGYYCLEMLPYPSGRIHMGHVRNYSIGDAVARFRRMRGDRVMHVIGWDSFGLPAENAAIEKREEPGAWTRSNIDAMREQFRRLGFAYDWDREISSCDPEYYRWNQWFFLRMLERGIAYRAVRLLNWCATCATVLANEQVVGGRCWRCDNPVSRREFPQWFLRITDYAQELLDDLDELPAWPERVRTMQRNWIGRSVGTRALFPVEGLDEPIEVFTTRVDTIYGATYMALAVEHPAIRDLVQGRPEARAVLDFVDEQLGKDLEERFAEGAEKLGVPTGRFAINPYSGEQIPIWVGNFVLMDVGTGAIMSVPAHDSRDFAFARKYGLPIRPVIRPVDGEALDAATMEDALPLDGVLHDSGPYSGLDSAAAREKMTADAREQGFGDASINFRLKDWGISRQRYWGTPIPIVYCDGCGPVGVPEHELPVLLPENVPLTGEGGSPLSRVEGWVATSCPKCGGPGRRETDTMDTFVDSSWYYFRYLDPHNASLPFDWSKVGEWFPVDLYIGGIEHATLHLIYTRFWTKMLRDLEVGGVDEPVVRLFTQGMVVKDGAKMSKSKGNVVDPDEMVDRYGADTTRLFSLFAAPPERDLDWSEKGIEGCARFLNRVWRTYRRAAERLPAAGSPAPADAADGDALALRRRTHRTIHRVTQNLGPRMHFNTAVSAIMELNNAVVATVDREDAGPGELWAVREAFEALARLLAPFAPHFADELWEALGGEGFVIASVWPEPDAALLVVDEVTLVVQVNGKLRARLTLPKGASEEQALEAARQDENVAGHLDGKTMRRVVHVPDRLLNLVVS